MKSFKEFSQDEQLVEQYTTEVLNLFQRMQRSRVARRSKVKRLVGMRRALKRIISDPKKLMKKAIRQQRLKTAKKILKGISLSAVSVARKMEVEKKLDKQKNRIKMLARKLLPQIKKDEKNKLKKKVV